MQRLTSIDADRATGRAKDLLQNVQQALGAVPNVTKVMANSPAVLESYLNFSQAMKQTAIGSKLHHQVKLAVSQSNSCDYCTSILSAVGAKVGLSADDILAGRTASAEDQRTDAALKFAQAVLDSRGKVTDGQLQTVREAGFGDAEIVEMVASVVLGCFTNFLNNVADTELDFPQAEPVACASEAACGCSA